MDGALGPSGEFEIYAYYMFELRRLLRAAGQPEDEITQVVDACEACVLQHFEGTFEQHAVKAGLTKRDREFNDELLPKCGGRLAQHIKVMHKTLAIVVLHRARSTDVAGDVRTTDSSRTALARLMPGLLPWGCTCAMTSYVPFYVVLTQTAGMGKPLSKLSTAETTHVAAMIADLVPKLQKEVKPEIEQLVADDLNRASPQGCLTLQRNISSSPAGV